MENKKASPDFICLSHGLQVWPGLLPHFEFVLIIKTFVSMFALQPFALSYFGKHFYTLPYTTEPAFVDLIKNKFFSSILFDRIWNTAFQKSPSTRIQALAHRRTIIRTPPLQLSQIRCSRPLTMELAPRRKLSFSCHLIWFLKGTFTATEYISKRLIWWYLYCLYLFKLWQLSVPV